MIWPVRSNACPTRVAEAVGDRHRRIGLPGQPVERAEHQVLLLLAVGVQLVADLLAERRLVSDARRRDPAEAEVLAGLRGQPLAQHVPVRQRLAVQRQDLIAAAQADLVGRAPRLDREHEQLGRQQAGLVVALAGGVEHRHRDDHRRAGLLDLDVRERHRRVAAAHVVEAQRRRAGAFDRPGELGPGRHRHAVDRGDEVERPAGRPAPPATTGRARRPRAGGSGATRRSSRRAP